MPLQVDDARSAKSEKRIMRDKESNGMHEPASIYEGLGQQTHVGATAQTGPALNRCPTLLYIRTYYYKYTQYVLAMFHNKYLYKYL